MHRPKLKIPRQPGRALGIKGGAEDQFDGKDHNAHCPVEIAQRRADSIRLQAVGQIGGGV